MGLHFRCIHKQAWTGVSSNSVWSSMDAMSMALSTSQLSDQQHRYSRGPQPRHSFLPDAWLPLHYRPSRPLEEILHCLLWVSHPSSVRVCLFSNAWRSNIGWLKNNITCIMSFSTLGIRKETLGRISIQTSLPGDGYSVHSSEDYSTHSRIRPRNSKSANEKGCSLQPEHRQMLWLSLSCIANCVMEYNCVGHFDMAFCVFSVKRMASREWHA